MLEEQIVKELAKKMLRLGKSLRAPGQIKFELLAASHAYNQTARILRRIKQLNNNAFQDHSAEEICELLETIIKLTDVLSAGQRDETLAELDLSKTPEINFQHLPQQEVNEIIKKLYKDLLLAIIIPISKEFFADSSSQNTQAETNLLANSYKLLVGIVLLDAHKSYSGIVENEFWKAIDDAISDFPDVVIIHQQGELFGKKFNNALDMLTQQITPEINDLNKRKVISKRLLPLFDLLIRHLLNIEFQLKLFLPEASLTAFNEIIETFVSQGVYSQEYLTAYSIEGNFLLEEFIKFFKLATKKAVQGNGSLDRVYELIENIRGEGNRDYLYELVREIQKRMQQENKTGSSRNHQAEKPPQRPAINRRWLRQESDKNKTKPDQQPESAQSEAFKSFKALLLKTVFYVNRDRYIFSPPIINSCSDYVDLAKKLNSNLSLYGTEWGRFLLFPILDQCIAGDLSQTMQELGVPGITRTKINDKKGEAFEYRKRDRRVLRYVVGDYTVAHFFIKDPSSNSDIPNLIDNVGNLRVIG